jgi:GAF domain-containing protein/HAMP domain-containing protein
MMEPISQPTNRATALGLLRRTGRGYIAVCVALNQLLLIPGILIWLVILRIDAEFTPAQLQPAALVLAVAGLAASLILVTGMQYLARSAARRLGRWARNETLTSGSPEELAAWRQITAAPGRYGLLSLLVMPAVMILPLLGYIYLNIQVHAIDAQVTSEKLIFAVMGGIVAVTSTVLLTTLIFERALVPAREVLLPRSFEAQLAGAAGLRIQRKFVLSIIGLVLVSVLLVAPIGYHIAYVILYEPLTSELVFEQLRQQSLIASALTVALGVVLAYLISRSLSTPIGELTEVFNKVERGDLHRRAKVIATDEVGELEVYFNRMISRLEDLQSNLENQVKARTGQLEATIEVGRVASSILDPDELIEKVTQLITDRFGYYYAAIFLVDENSAWAELKAATGEAGKILKERRHRLPIGGKSMVSSAIQSRRGKIALDVGAEATRFDNPLLPRTRSEIALPLIAGNRVVGALDVQSVQAAAFDESDISTLQNMANQVAIAIENAHLFRETEAALSEIRAANAQAFQRAWSDLARGGPVLSYDTGGAPSGDGDGQSLEVALSLRGQTLGSIMVEGVDDWTPEQRALLEAIAGQTALALENARLISESQQSALRERLAAAITERIWSSSSVEAILQTTVREIGRALEASEATIELSVGEQDE